MSKKTAALIALILVSPVIIYFLWPTDEARIRRLFREGAGAVENKKIEDVMSKISFNYTDDHSLSYLAIKELMKRSFERMNNIKVEYGLKDIVISDKTASVGMDIRVIATYDKDTGYVVGDAARPVRVKFFLEKERTTWLVTRTEGLDIGH